MFFRFFKTKFFLLLLIAVLSFTVFALVKVSIKQKAIQTEIDQLSSKRDRIQEENYDLAERLNKASSNSDPELLAKRTLNYKRPGETVFVFYPVKDAPIISPAGSINQDRVFSADEPAEREVGIINNAVLWWRYFFE